MNKILLVVDMQNDFVTGALGTKEAQSIVSKVAEKVNEYKSGGHTVVFSRDTHKCNYLNTQEGKMLPVVHCVEGELGHQIVPQLCTKDCLVIDKYNFGSLDLVEQIAKCVKEGDVVELCGVCTDICVVSNALLLKARLPETKLIVDAQACAGSTVANHLSALNVLKACQVCIKE